MYHAQTPPPTHAYMPEISGLTWVDLVFPFFLFAMGAALPFSIGGRLERGHKWWRIATDVVLRFLQLAFFAIFIQHFYPYVLSSPQDLRSWLLAIAAFAVLFPMFMRFEKVPMWGRVVIKVAAYGVAVVMLLTTDFALVPKFSPEFSNIIILILSNVSLFAGVVYLATSAKWLNGKGRMVRAVLFVALALLVLGADVEGSWAGDVMHYSPLWWLLRMDYLRYLLILLPAMEAGEMLRESMKESAVATERGKKSDGWAVVLAAASLVLIVATLGTVQNHQIGLWAIVSVATLLVMGVAANRVSGSMGTLWQRLTLLAVVLMALGIVAEPLQGGIKKDPATLGYLFTTAGLAVVALVALSVVVDYFGCRKASAFLWQSGQNPMVAYVACDLVVYPLLNITGGVALLWPLHSSPWLGALHGVILTTVTILITMLTTRQKWFWRT
jgi:predicted acyltransferase